MKTKKSMLLTVVILLLCPFNITNAVTVEEPIQSGTIDYVGCSNYTEITDKNIITTIAQHDNLENPDKITKIQIDVINSENYEGHHSFEKLHETNAKKGKVTTVIMNEKDCGDYYKYENNYHSYWCDGTLESTNTFRLSASAKISSALSIPTDMINIKFGVQLGVSDTYQGKTKSFIPEGKRANVKTWVNYQKIAFDVYSEYDDGGLLFFQGTGKLYRPVGLIIQKTYYDL